MGASTYRTLLLSALVVTAIACKADKIDIEDLPDEVADAWCDQLVRCGLVESAADCGDIWGNIDPDLLAGVDNGSIDYDGELAAECVDDFADADCDPSSRDQRAAREECDDAFTGTLAEGADCYVDEQCISRNCDVPPCELECCLGTCGEPLPPDAEIGESCADVNCVDTAWCDESSTCVALKGRDEPCFEENECDFGLGCYTLTEAMPTCQPLPGEGEPCPSDSYRSCDSEGLVCDPITAICLPTLYEGDACEPEASRCAALYLFCDPDTSTCSQYPGLGEDCPNYQCSGDAYCDFDWGTLSGTCRALKEDGDNCDYGYECVSGYCTADEECGVDEPCIH